MNKERRKSLLNLGIIAGIILFSLLGGYLAGPEQFELVSSILKAIALVLLGLTLLVTIHELGHFLTAKMFGMRVEVFSIGFPPKLFGFNKGDTDYQIGATPLGGYVKISGMIDESLDQETIDRDKKMREQGFDSYKAKDLDPDNLPDWAPKPYEFRAKPVWQRLIVMVGGVVMNVLLGIFIFSMLLFSTGERKIPVGELSHGIYVRKTFKGEDKCGNEITKKSLGHYLGFQTGDKLVSVNGEAFKYLNDYLDPSLLLGSDAYFEVERSGSVVRLDVPEDILNQFSSDTIEISFFGINQPAKIAVVEKDEKGNALPAAKAKLKTGDLITAVNEVPIAFYADLQEALPKFANDTVILSVMRGQDSLSFSVLLDDKGRLGVFADSTYLMEIKQDTFKYSFFTSFIPGTKKAFSTLSGNAQGLGKVFTGQVSASKSVMGPVAIAKQYLNVFTQGGWYEFFRLTAILSMVLAFVNILPIPALDGGHVVFLLIEAITRREPSTKIRLIAQQIGMFLVLGLMVLIIFNDVFTQFINNCP